jgi:alpha-soluble NSF attachment protein
MSQSQAVLLLLKAQKKLNTSPGWFNFGSNSSQYEESGDLFQQAANQFKIEKRFKEAGDAFKGEAECREKMNEANEASNAWWNAAKAYKQGYPECNFASIGTLCTSVDHVSSGH